MFFTIYKITNTANGKFYIGKHQTKNLDDGYFGSGKLIKRAIEKYGKDKFKKEILHVFDSEEEMNSKEKELVVVSEHTYNLCEGGQGGFGHIIRQGLNFGPQQKASFEESRTERLGVKKIQYLWENDPAWAEKERKIQSSRIKKYLENNPSWWIGRKHKESSKRKTGAANAIHQAGSGNSMYGMMWITDGIVSTRIKKDGDIPDGWRKGRVVKPT